MILNAFAGPGGWCTGVRLAGYDGPMVGLEWDRDACATGHTAGHARVRADVATYPTRPFAGLVDGLIASPPCQAWSAAGDRLGELDRPLVFARIGAFAAGREPDEAQWADERSKLTAEPMRWAVALRPPWVALEQVPAVLPLWQYTAELLRGLGYRAWAGILSAEEYGVPQTRKRAILIARRDGQPVGPPAPTHQPYRAGRAYDTEHGLFGPPLPPPVSMADALGWDGDGTVMRNGNQANACTRSIDEPAGTLFFGRRSNAVDWIMRNGAQENATERHLDEPAGTVFCSRSGNLSWRMHPAGLTGSYGYSRAFDAPSPVIKGAGSGGQYLSDGATTTKVTVEQAAVLQSFPPDYPLQGTKSSRYRQIGDAVPPLLAAAIVGPLLRGAA